MQRIIISESDLSSNADVVSSYDVAYVPGFMYGSDDALETYYRQPVLFTSRYEFVNKIGSQVVPTFSADQEYPKYEAGESDGFTKKAIPSSGKMFTQGDADLGYRIALYLLSLGMPVYYEVMNNTNTGTFTTTYVYKKITSEDIFNSIITYYSLKSSQKQITTSVTADKISAKVTDKTFAEKVNHVSGTYVFTGTKDTDAITWTLAGEAVTIADYGITTSAEEEAGPYTITITLTDLSADEISTEIAPTDENSMFEIADTASLSDFDPAVTYYTLTETDICPIDVKSMYAGLKNRFIDTPTNSDTTFDSIGDYSVKYLTSGGYPVFEYCDKTSSSSFALMTAMIDMAQSRGDAIALIDHTDNPERDIYPSSLGGSGTAVVDIMRGVGQNIANGSYGAMFTPWYECTHSAITSSALSAQVPASIAYLSALAVQLRDYNAWLAVAGTTRGLVPYITSSDNSDTLHTTVKLTNNIADSYQVLPTDSNISQISINPITYIRNVGYCLWGNRTLRNNGTGTSALSFLNVRGVVSDIVKRLFAACQANLFNQNNDVTWINFRSSITPLLDQMQSNYILQDYSITRYTTDPTTGEAVPSYKLLAIIKVSVITPIEVFELNIQLENANDNTTVTIA